MLVLLSALLAAAPQPGELRTFRDWTVGCDNARSCHATSLMPENGDWDRPVTLSVKRAGKAEAPPMLAIGADGEPARMLVGGKALEVRLVPGEGELAIDPRDTAAALDALRAGDALMLEDRSGTAIGTVSLAGLSAALLYMDDRQKRVGTVTALQRPGTRPAEAVPPVPALPTVRSASRNVPLRFRLTEDQIDALRARHECVAGEPDWPGYASEQYPLDESHGLLLLGCGAGAYNYTYVPFVFSRDEVRPARFDLPPRWTEADDVASLVNADWDPESGTLTSFAKGRGLGDCGIGSDYAWDGERFRLVHQIEMNECRGSLDYVTTWRAEVVRPQ